MLNLKRNLFIVAAGLAVGLLPLPAKAQSLLAEFLQCTKDHPIAESSPCNWFAGKAMERIWGIKDFQRPGKPGEYLLANEIADFVAVSRCWAKLGTADSDLALEQAARDANDGQPVVAVFKDMPNGHVALVTKGPVSFSGTWNTNVPNSASFFLNKPQNSYVDGPLSKAFGKEKRPRVILYSRKLFAPECV